jgi:hypothetical protein
MRMSESVNSRESKIFLANAQAAKDVDETNRSRIGECVDDALSDRQRTEFCVVDSGGPHAASNPFWF